MSNSSQTRGAELIRELEENLAARMRRQNTTHPPPNQACSPSDSHRHAASSLAQTASNSSSSGSPLLTGEHTVSATRLAPPGRSPAKLFDISAAQHSPVSDGVGQPSLRLLSGYDVVFIIDDTGSMQLPFSTASAPAFSMPSSLTNRQQQSSNVVDRWNVLRRALEKFVTIAAEYITDGTDLRFLKHVHLNDRDDDEAKSNGIKNKKQVQELLKEIQVTDPICGGGTVLKVHLEAVISSRMSKIRNWAQVRGQGNSSHPPKPLNLIIVTDGVANDGGDVMEYIISVARELDRLEAPESYIGIQFVQIGDDINATEFLRGLDDKLRLLAGDKSLRDIVDATPFRRSLHDEEPQGEADGALEFLKILLGAIDKRLDDLEIH